MAFDPPRETPEEFKEKHILLWVPVSWVQIMLAKLDMSRAPEPDMESSAFESKVARIKRVLRSKLYGGKS